MPGNRKEESSIADHLREALKDKVEWTGPLRPEILCHPGTPHPMCGVAPRVVLGSAWWQKERRAAFESTDHHCVACGVHKYEAEARQWLEGHEVYDIDYPRGRMKYVETCALCHYCHNYVHIGRLQHLLEQNQIHHSKYVAIIQHGDAILESAGLSKVVNVGPVAEWSKWRLCIGRRRFKPKYKSYEEFMKASGCLDEDTE